MHIHTPYFYNTSLKIHTTKAKKKNLCFKFFLFCSLSVNLIVDDVTGSAHYTRPTHFPLNWIFITGCFPNTILFPSAFWTLLNLPRATEKQVLSSVGSGKMKVFLIEWTIKAWRFAEWLQSRCTLFCSSYKGQLHTDQGEPFVLCPNFGVRVLVMWPIVWW